MNEPLTVYEDEQRGLYRTFTICNQLTQEPLNGFAELVMNVDSAVEFARRLSATDTDEEVEAIRLEAVRVSDQVQFDIGHL